MKEKGHLRNIDIDTTIEEFVDRFKNTYMVNVPNKVLADRRKILKKIIEFYKARGTEKSYKFFFRILLDQESDFFFPRTQLLRPSDGKWVQYKTLRVFALNGNPFDLVGRKIIGRNRNTTAFIENVHRLQEDIYDFYELFLNRSSITGQFEVGEIVEDLEGSGLRLEISPIPIGVTITNPGSGYTVGQNIPITNGLGTGAVAFIKAVTDTGGIKTIRMRSFGVGYYDTPTIDFSLGGTITNPAEGIVNIGALSTYQGFFINNDGFPSDTIYLQDGIYWQQFSYVTIVNESLSVYRDDLLKQLHPSGLKLFGNVRSQNKVFAGTGIPDNQRCSFRELTWRTNGNYAVKAGMQNCYSKLTRIMGYDVSDRVRIGATYRSLELRKFRYKPYEAYDANQDFVGSVNPNYWSTSLGNTQIKDFGHIVIGDFKNYPMTPTNIMPDSNIVQNPHNTIRAYSIGSGEDVSDPNVN